MNQKKLKTLVAAGVFSAALMSGKLYADDQKSTDMPKTGKTTAPKTLKGHSCKGMNSCKGKGGCKTGDQGCHGKNTCKGLGGCATGDYKGKAAPKATPKSSEAPTGMDDKSTGKNGCSGKNGCAGK